MKAWLALVLALSATGVSGQTADLSEGHDGDFGAKLVITDDAEGLYSGWQQPGTWQVSTTSQITRSRPVEAVIIFHDCAPGSDGNCEVTVHFELTKPDGRPYQQALDAVAWKHPPLPDHALIPSEAGMGFRLEPADQLGRYVLRATLTDTISGKSLTLVETITAVEEQSPAPMPTS